jgi:hypothetical protein
VKMGVWVVHLYGGTFLRESNCAGQKEEERYQERFHLLLLQWCVNQLSTSCQQFAVRPAPASTVAGVAYALLFVGQTLTSPVRVATGYTNNMNSSFVISMALCLEYFNTAGLFGRINLN